MRRVISVSVLALLALAAFPAVAQIAITNGWVRGVVPGQKTAAAFMQLLSATDVSLVGVSSPVARTAQVHAMQFEGGIMKMRPVGTLPLRAGKPLEFTPGDRHIMLMDLTGALRPGDTVPLTLQFEDRSGRKWSLDIKLPVKAPTSGNAPESR